MIDHLKRKTLKTIVTGASCAAVPVLGGAMAATASADCSSRHTTAVDDSVMNHATVSGLEIELDAIPDSDNVWVRLTNITDQSVKVRHINPGVVRLAGRRYDVNSIFDGATSIYQGEAQEIEPDNSYSYIVAPLSSAANIVEIPQTRISPFLATVTTPTDGLAPGDVLTPRMVLA